MVLPPLFDVLRGANGSGRWSAPCVNWTCASVAFGFDDFHSMHRRVKADDPGEKRADRFHETDQRRGIPCFPKKFPVNPKKFPVPAKWNLRISAMSAIPEVNSCSNSGALHPSEDESRVDLAGVK
jgi:hypothetical protein